MGDKKISVLVDESLFKLYERYCDERGFKKSTLIVRLIREHLGAEGFASQEELFDHGTKALIDSEKSRKGSTKTKR